MRIAAAWAISTKRTFPTRQMLDRRIAQCPHAEEGIRMACKECLRSRAVGVAGEAEVRFLKTKVIGHAQERLVLATFSRQGHGPAAKVRETADWRGRPR